MKNFVKRLQFFPGSSPVYVNVFIIIINAVMVIINVFIIIIRIITNVFIIKVNYEKFAIYTIGFCEKAIVKVSRLLNGNL